MLCLELARLVCSAGGKTPRVADSSRRPEPGSLRVVNTPRGRPASGETDGIRLQKASGACRGSEAASILKLRRKMDTTESEIVSSKLLQRTRGGWGNEAYTSKVARRRPARAAESVVRCRPARWAAVGGAEAVVRCRPARWAAVGGAGAVVWCRPARRTAVERRQPALADGRGARRFRVVGAPWGLERRRRWFDTRRGAARGPALRRQTSALRGLGDGHGRNLSSPRAHEVAADA